MLTPEERALVTDMGDTLLDLYAKRDEAILDGNLDRVHRLQAEISELQPSDRKSSTASRTCKMMESADRMERRHVCEKSVIDHLADKVFEPAASIDEPPNHSPTTPTGLPVEEQVRKEWNPRMGGLPILCRK